MSSRSMIWRTRLRLADRHPGRRGGHVEQHALVERRHELVPELENAGTVTRHSRTATTITALRRRTTKRTTGA